MIFAWWEHLTEQWSQENTYYIPVECGVCRWVSLQKVSIPFSLPPITYHGRLCFANLVGSYLLTKLSCLNQPQSCVSADVLKTQENMMSIHACSISQWVSTPRCHPLVHSRWFGAHTWFDRDKHKHLRSSLRHIMVVSTHTTFGDRSASTKFRGASQVMTPCLRKTYYTTERCTGITIAPISNVYQEHVSEHGERFQISDVQQFRYDAL